MQPQSHTFLQGEETMLSKAWSIVALTVTILGMQHDTGVRGTWLKKR